MKRRTFIKAIIGSSIVGILPTAGQAARYQSTLRFLRPPGSLPEDEFLKRCIHCGKCGEVCPNRTIKYFQYQNGLASMDTPYIIPRDKACILCMKCGEVCPTGAIKKVIREARAIIRDVQMGKARVDRSLCLSWQGKTCGVCYRACPLADVAIRVGRLEQPHVLKDCVGCGLCERSCIQIPQAIRIIPRHESV